MTPPHSPPHSVGTLVCPLVDPQHEPTPPDSAFAWAGSPRLQSLAQTTCHAR